jgi:hypothetical protein
MICRGLMDISLQSIGQMPLKIFSHEFHELAQIMWNKN